MDKRGPLFGSFFQRQGVITEIVCYTYHLYAGLVGQQRLQPAQAQVGRNGIIGPDAHADHQLLTLRGSEPNEGQMSLMHRHKLAED